MNYNITKATLSDLDEIYKLQENYDHLLISKNTLAQEFNNNLSLYYIATETSNSNIIGAIGGTILVDHVDISIIITKKDLTKKGIASSLLTKLIDYCKSNNIEKIFLEVRTSNLPAINLYEKFNFTKIATRKNYYSDNNEDALIYMLKI